MRERKRNEEPANYEFESLITKLGEVLRCMKTSTKVDSWIRVVQFQQTNRPDQDCFLILHTLRNSFREYSTTARDIGAVRLADPCLFYYTSLSRQFSRISIDVPNLQNHSEIFVCLPVPHKRMIVRIVACYG